MSSTHSEAFYLAVYFEYQPVEEELAVCTRNYLYLIEVSHLADDELLIIDIYLQVLSHLLVAIS